MKKLRNQGDGDPNAGYLKEKPDGWLASNFSAGSYKAERRRYFVQ